MLLPDFFLAKKFWFLFTFRCYSQIPKHFAVFLEAGKKCNLWIDKFHINLLNTYFIPGLVLRVGGTDESPSLRSLLWH
jgi:hypothetical protein